MNPIFLEFTILFLQRAGSYDGDIEGGSISNLLDSAGRLLYVVVGIVVLVYIVRNLYEYFIDARIKREKEMKEYFDKKCEPFKPVKVINHSEDYGYSILTPEKLATLRSTQFKDVDLKKIIDLKNIVENKNDSTKKTKESEDELRVHLFVINRAIKELERRFEENSITEIQFNQDKKALEKLLIMTNEKYNPNNKRENNGNEKGDSEF